MNKLVRAKFQKNNSGTVVEIYNHSTGKTGLYVKNHEPKIINIEIESFVEEFKKQKGYKLIEEKRQVKERVFGNADEAYKTITF